VADAEDAAAGLKAGLARAIRPAARLRGGREPVAGQRATRLRKAAKPGLADTASDPASKPAALWRVAMRSRHPAVVRALAANPSVPPRLLRFLRQFARWDVLVALAGNANTPPGMHRSLARSRYWAVAAAAAANPTARPKVLARLALRGDPRISLAAATNPALASDLAEVLLRSSNVYVRGVAAANAAAPPDALRKLASGMSEPAWVLRAVATNPSCPAVLSDQLLTWITLGGSGKADPLFDPVRCTGHPAGADVPLMAWYAEEAKRAGAEGHPLWRVRAGVASARKRLPFSVISALRRDPRPEVRRSVAGFIGTRPGQIRELMGDADAAVARRAGQVCKANRRRYLRRRVLPRALGFVPAAAVISVVGLTASHSGTSPAPNPAVLRCAANPAWLSPGWSTSAMARPTEQQTVSLPGGGWLACGPSWSAANQVLVTTGSSKLVLNAPVAMQAPNGWIYNGKSVLFSAIQQNLLYIVGSPDLVKVTIAPDGNPSQVLTVTLVFAGAKP